MCKVITTLFQSFTVYNNIFVCMCFGTLGYGTDQTNDTLSEFSIKIVFFHIFISNQKISLRTVINYTLIYNNPKNLLKIHTKITQYITDEQQVLE